MRFLYLFLIIVSIKSYAGFDEFQCTVKHSVLVDQQGRLIDQQRHQTLIDRVFRVNKNTGAITGAFVTDGVKTQPSIIDYGSEGQPFKVLIPYYPETTVDFLLIHSYVDNPKKPFTFLTLDSIFTGLCSDE